MKTHEDIKPNYGPVYAAALYPDLCKIFQSCGYALAVHGSLARDFDLIAVKWRDDADSKESVIKKVFEEFASLSMGAESPKQMEAGRIAYTIVIEHTAHIDLSFIETENHKAGGGTRVSPAAAKEILDMGMTMSPSELGIALALMSRGGEWTTADELASLLKTDQRNVRKVLPGAVRAGLLETKKKVGGVRLFYRMPRAK